jgi:hypothetical protein
MNFKDRITTIRMQVAFALVYFHATLNQFGIPNDWGEANVSGGLTIHKALLDHMLAGLL